jgi:NADPH2:quinone reductase
MTSTDTMIAASYGVEGPATVISVTEVTRPDPGPGQVRVRVMVSAINPTDTKGRSGLTPRPIDGFQVPHMDGAGIIDAVGPGVDPTRIGERVWVMFAALTRWGTAAQWCIVRSEHAVELPDEASFDLGATLGVPAMTAAVCLFGSGSLAGRDVLVSGVGAVGHAAICLARWAGARVVATVSGPQKATIAEQAGAHLAVNYREPGAAQAIKQFSDGIDLVVEVALGANLELDLAVCRRGATVVAYAIDGPDPVIPVRRCMTAGLHLRFMLLYAEPSAELHEAVRAVDGVVRAGALRTPAVQRYPLDEIVAAHLAQEAGGIGKILIDIPD